MTTIADELKQCLPEMQTASDKMKKLLDTPGIVWPEVEELKTIDTVIINGDPYREVEVSDENGCDGCAFLTINCFNFSRPHCSSRLRGDGKYVIFKKA
jgi:hypothetical protein